MLSLSCAIFRPERHDARHAIVAVAAERARAARSLQPADDCTSRRASHQRVYVTLVVCGAVEAIVRIVETKTRTAEGAPADKVSCLPIIGACLQH